MSLSLILTLSAGVYALRLAGLAVGSVIRNEAMLGAIRPLPVAVLASFVAVDAVGLSQGSINAPRIIGVLVALVAGLLRAPLLAVLVLGMASAALMRLMFQ